MDGDYSTPRLASPDHGAQPTVLVVFDDELAAIHLLHIARGEMTRTDVHVPLMASHRRLLEREGPLGRAWFAHGGSEPDVMPKQLLAEPFQIRLDQRQICSTSPLGCWVAQPLLRPAEPDAGQPRCEPFAEERQGRYGVAPRP